MLKRIRITLATVMFILITLLFLDVLGTLHKWLHVLANIQFIPALLALNVGVVIALVLLTLIFGRIYCSVICPLGIMQDIITKLGTMSKKNRFRYSPAKNWLRYAFLLLFIVALVGGIGSIAALLEPYSSFGRIANNLLQPVYQAGNNIFAAIAKHFNSYAFYSVDIWMKSLPTFIIAIATFIIIAILAWRNGRTYCNTICPVGTVLGFISRFSWMKVHIDTDKCNGCGLCGRNCKASAIDTKNHKIDYSRCVVCGDCIEKCKQGAIKFSPTPTLPLRGGSQIETPANNNTNPSPSPKGEGRGGASGASPSRRSFLLATAMATTAAALAQENKKVDGGLAAIEDKVAPNRKTPITPPGSLSARHFAQHCTACQLCVSKCPNDVLRPSTDLMTMMQPIMSYERGYCRPECTACSDVCPTDAIKPITRADKSSTQIGRAVLIKKNCLSYTDGVSCGNCERHCPTGAITMVPSDKNNPESPLIPAVNENRCIGCGACENLCPARPFSAIYVEGFEVHRTN